MDKDMRYMTETEAEQFLTGVERRLLRMLLETKNEPVWLVTSFTYTPSVVMTDAAYKAFRALAGQFELRMHDAYRFSMLTTELATKPHIFEEDVKNNLNFKKQV